MKTIACKDLGINDCNFVAKGNSDDEVIKKIQSHAKMQHPAEFEKMAKTMSDEQIKNLLMSKIKEV